MKKVLIIIAVLVLSIVAGVVIVRASDGVSPMYTLVDNEGNVVAEIWEVGNDKFVSGEVEHYCSCDDECFTQTLLSTTSFTQDPTSTQVYIPESPTPESSETSVAPTPTRTTEPTYCHCEQGEGALGRKNCHVAKYNNGHAKHEWDFWSTDGTCTGWNH